MTSERPTLSVAQSMQMAWRHYQAGTREDAKKISLLVLKVEPKNPDALHLIGILAYEANNPEMAIDFISEAIRSHKKYAPMHGNLALAKLAKGDLNGAAMSARKAFSLQPSYADAHRVMGLVHQHRGSFREAVQEFQRARDLGLHTADLEGHLAKALQQLNYAAARQAASHDNPSTGKLSSPVDEIEK